MILLQGGFASSCVLPPPFETIRLSISHNTYPPRRRVRVTQEEGEEEGEREREVLLTIKR
jgi:hypothetical protein